MSTSEPEPESKVVSSNSAATATSPANESIFQQRQLRWPVLLILLFWIAYVAVGMLELPMFTGFLARSGILLVLMLSFSIWWLLRGPVRLSFRFLVLGWAVACGIIATLAMHQSVLAPSIFFLMLPTLLTAWAVWLLIARSFHSRTRLTGMLVIVLLLSIPGMLVRMEGLRGDGRGDFHWRWSRSGEQRFELAGGKMSDIKAKPIATEPLVVSADDWTGFRGPNRDATVTGVKIETSWEKSPPALCWRTRVGPAWSSMAIVGGHLFTQEQRGETEVVSCFDVETGQPIWIHGDPLRFEEPLGGVGPRATPQFADGRIYTLSAKGRLNCLDAATGEKRWSQDIVQSSADTLPNWGYSGSPLVIDGRVIVFAGGKSEKALLAYDAETGNLIWKAVAGLESYSSPHAVVLENQSQVLFVGDEELTALEPASGKVLWKFKHAASFGRPVVQPRLVGDSKSKILVSFLPDAGVSELEIIRQADSWNVREVWNSRHIKPDYSDFVHHDGHVYGFDGSIFCCVNLATGKRQWKGGRYGAGQVLLLADQRLLLVLTEDGEVVLVEANPAKHHELARFQAIQGKTWNHPVISHGKLFVRNAEEMACFQLN